MLLRVYQKSRMNANFNSLRRKFAPAFSQSFTGILICFAICFFLAQVVRVMLDIENKNRTKLYGQPTFDKALEDLSDKENTSFRYAL
jgi:hypothetical protein